MLRVVKNVLWKQHMRNQVLYGEIPKITTAIAAQRVRDSAGTAGEARMILPTSYYYGNQHMAKELVGD